jgi:hypothetical protein
MMRMRSAIAHDSATIGVAQIVKGWWVGIDRHNQRLVEISRCGAVAFLLAETEKPRQRTCGRG